MILVLSGGCSAGDGRRKYRYISVQFYSLYTITVVIGSGLMTGKLDIRQKNKNPQGQVKQKLNQLKET